MSAIGTGFKKGALRFFMPEISSRRVLREGFARQNLIVWGVFTVAIAFTALFLAGTTVTLYLPHYYAWQWLDVTVFDPPFWGWLALWALVGALCLYPRTTTIAIGMAF